MPGRRTDATTIVPGTIVDGTFAPTSTTRPSDSCPVIRYSCPSGASPYSAALISLSVPSTPTRSTSTSTPRPSGISSSDGSGTSRRCIELGTPGCTATAFIRVLLLLDGCGLRRRRLEIRYRRNEKFRRSHGRACADSGEWQPGAAGGVADRVADGGIPEFGDGHPRRGQARRAPARGRRGRVRDARRELLRIDALHRAVVSEDTRGGRGGPPGRMAGRPSGA